MLGAVEQVVHGQRHSPDAIVDLGGENIAVETPHHFVGLPKVVAGTPYIARTDGRKIDAIGKIGTHDGRKLIIRGIDGVAQVFDYGTRGFELQGKSPGATLNVFTDGSPVRVIGRNGLQIQFVMIDGAGEFMLVMVHFAEVKPGFRERRFFRFQDIAQHRLCFLELVELITAQRQQKFGLFVFLAIFFDADQYTLRCLIFVEVVKIGSLLFFVSECFLCKESQRTKKEQKGTCEVAVLHGQSVLTLKR